MAQCEMCGKNEHPENLPWRVVIHKIETRDSRIEIKLCWDCRTRLLAFIQDKKIGAYLKTGNVPSNTPSSVHQERRRKWEKANADFREG